MFMLNRFLKLAFDRNRHIISCDDLNTKTTMKQKHYYFHIFRKVFHLTAISSNKIEFDVMKPMTYLHEDSKTVAGLHHKTVH